MNEFEFKKFWETFCPEAVPASHYFKHYYPERWLRIHSLPKSKRYAETDEEWKILLERQNRVATDLLGLNGKCCLVIDDHYLNYNKDILQKLNFKPVDVIDIHELNPEDFGKGSYMKIFLTEIKWDLRKLKTLLRAIANDQCEAFFIGVEQQCLIAPYDGGVDLILRDKETRDRYKEKYKAWLSAREDGL